VSGISVKGRISRRGKKKGSGKREFRKVRCRRGLTCSKEKREVRELPDLSKETRRPITEKEENRKRRKNRTTS